MSRIWHRLGHHDWPEVWTKYGNRESVNFDGLWWEVFEKVCPCGARRTLNGPLRHPRSLGGGISDVNYR